MGEYAILGVLALVGSMFVISSVLVSRLISARSPEVGSKLDPYECGAVAIGTARIQFKVGFYLFALMFLIFDVEALFLFPCLAVFRSIASGAEVPLSLAYFEIGVFVAILALGLIYAWKNDVLRWE